MNQFNDPAIKHKLGLLELAEQLRNVSRACKLMGISRETFYRVRDAYEHGGVEALLAKSKKVPNPKNRVEEHVEKAVCEIAVDNPALGQQRVSNELRKTGIFVSPGGVRSIWQRHDLETFRKRLKALEAHVATTGNVLTEAQLVALEKKKEADIACGEIETAHPGYLGSQDTFFVGTLKGVGRVYQQTFVDTYSKIAHCKLYITKTPITAADLLNDKVLPFFAAHDIPILRILTDRGTEFCGKLEQHDYELYLAACGIEHSKTRARHPQTNGICERFHKTILNEFYQVTFRKKVYNGLDELQKDLDAWVNEYNCQRTHQGKMCCGRTPMQTLEEGKNLCKEKQIA